LYRTDFHALAAPGARVPVRVPHEISRHQGIPRDLSAPDAPHIPAGTAATVAVVLDFAFCIVHKVNKACLFRLSDQFKGFLLADLSCEALVNNISGHIIVLHAHFRGMLASLPRQSVCHSTPAVGQGDHLGLFDHRFHQLLGKNGLLCRGNAPAYGNVPIRFGGRPAECFPGHCAAEVFGGHGSHLSGMRGVLVFPEESLRKTETHLLKGKAIPAFVGPAGIEQPSLGQAFENLRQLLSG